MNMNNGVAVSLISRRILESSSDDDDQYHLGPDPATLAIVISSFTVVAIAFCVFICIFNKCQSQPDSPDPPSKSLPLIPYSSSLLMVPDCAICLADFRETESVKLIPLCGHVFHPTCLDSWLASRRTCPLCRSADIFSLDAPPHPDTVVEMNDVDTCTHAGLTRASTSSDLPNLAVLRTTAGV